VSIDLDTTAVGDAPFRAERPQETIDRHALAPDQADGVPAFASPERLLALLAGWQPIHIVATALDLRVPTLIAGGAVDRPALLAATGASERGLDMLLNGLVALRFVLRDGTGDEARYSLAPDAAAFLVEGPPTYLGGYVRFAAKTLTEQWRGLTESVRTGRPAVSLEDPEQVAAYWEEQVDLLFPWNYPLASHVGQLLSALHPDGAPQLLDVSAGAGVWGIAAAQAHPGLEVVAVDLPGVIDHARRTVAQLGLEGRFAFEEADILSGYDFGAGRFDVAVLGQVCHIVGAEASRRLFADVARAMRPGGTIVIADMLPNEERSGTLFTLVQALTMLVSTPEGQTFTFGEYEGWLRETGFEDVRPVEAFGQTIVFATRAG
jgi:SAM-dependent methyltransferase